MEDLIELVNNKYDIDLTKDIQLLSINLPYTEERHGCKNLKYNGGLYTQCCKKCDGDFCKVCRIEMNKDGPKYGTTYDRRNFKFGEFVSNKGGKQEIEYTKYMKTHSYTKEIVIEAAKWRNITLPDSLFNTTKKKINRKEDTNKRDVVVCDTESETSEANPEVKRGRGRPKKEDIKIANAQDKENDAKDIKKNNKELEEEIELNDNGSSEHEESDDEQEMAEIEVRKIIYKGKTYLKEIKTNKVYSEDGDEIGVYDEKNEKILMN